MTRVARDSPKQRQSPEVRCGPIGCARAVISLLESKRHPRVQFVLNVSGKEIAPAANGSESSRIPLPRLVKAIRYKGGPSCVTAFRIGIKETRKRKAQLHTSTFSANGPLRRHCGYSIQQSKDYRRCTVDRGDT